MKDFKQTSEGVFLHCNDPVTISRHDLDFLKEQVNNNDRKRARICAHQHLDSMVHEMIITLSKESYIHPHKHNDKTESFHIIEGCVDLITFNPSGKIIHTITLAEKKSIHPFFYRLDQKVFHTLYVHSPYVVIHEVTNGPFSKSDTILAPWAPFEKDFVEVSRYKTCLSRRIKNFQSK